MIQGWQTGTHVALQGFPALLLMTIVMVVVYGIPVMRIVRRVGFSSQWGLLAAVPFVNIDALWVFAFRNWPVEERR